jgi:hypothetical protein
MIIENLMSNDVDLHLCFGCYLQIDWNPHDDLQLVVEQAK